MKKFIPLHTLPALMLALFCHVAAAQDYLLTNRGDSLAGEIRPLLYGPQKKVQVISPDKGKTTFSLFEVREYSLGGELFRPVKADNGYVFMKLLQPGYLSVYAFQQENQARFDGLFLKKMDGAQLVVPNLGFKKYVGQFLEDCPSVVQKIKDGELGKKNLMELVTLYNACVSERTIDHRQVIARIDDENQKVSLWDSLEEKVRARDFAEKTNALEMIGEIKNKIRQEEKIPNFLIEGLKNSLEGAGLSDELNAAIGETKN
ncbi:MAG TPA: hypothetical protein VF490_10520 [Chryseosolibacter sp.]